MHDPCAYDYALIRVIPHVERGECINAGVLVCSTARAFLKARIELDEARLLALDPAADLATVAAALEAFVRICEGGSRAGPIGELPLRARFDWLVAPRSTVIQTSPVHSGRCSDLELAMEHLLERMVRRPPLRPPAG
ncbi:DUF3037 domain-containing protein [Ramlibacter sp. AN1133]|uniref:DUF3037 domain-containing protein n=1 Tax=Ramlibacter sp. AN1133 TaxID=3133429 RepID=UPI0030BFC4DF